MFLSVVYCNYVSLIGEELCQFLHEGVDILKAAVDRREADVCHLVHALEAGHDHLAYIDRLYFTLKIALELLFYIVRNALKRRERDRALLAGSHHAVYKLDLVEGLAAPVALDDDQRQSLNDFICGKALLAGKALAAAAYRCALLCRARIDDLALGISAKRAFHISFSPNPQN